MNKIIIGIAGLILFIISISIYLFIFNQEKKAIARDDEEKSSGYVQGPPLCTWEAKLPSRVIPEDKSQALVVSTSNSENEACVSTINLSAPGFDISPSQNSREISLQPKQKGSISWVLIPRNSGEFEITVSDDLNTIVLGVTITDIFGLTSVQAKMFSIFGTLFGPMLTIPWWFDRFFKKKKQEKIKIPNKIHNNICRGDST